LFSILILVPVRAQTQDTVSLQSPVYRQALERETFDLVNAYRKANGLPGLQWDDTIAKVSRGHSKDMADDDVDFGHDGFSDRVDQLKKAVAGLSFEGAGEKVLRTNDPREVARVAVSLWLKSPHHLKNIRGDFNYSGMGVWVDDKGMIYFTQVFLKLEPVTTVAQTPPPPAVQTPFGFLAVPSPTKTSH